MQNKRAPGGYFAIPERAVDEKLPQIGATAFAVYSVLLRMAEGRGYCDAGRSDIAVAANTVVRNVSRHIRTLEDHNMIFCVGRTGRREGRLPDVILLLHPKEWFSKPVESPSRQPPLLIEVKDANVIDLAELGCEVIPLLRGR